MIGGALASLFEFGKAEDEIVATGPRPGNRKVWAQCPPMNGKRFDLAGIELKAPAGRNGQKPGGFGEECPRIDSLVCPDNSPSAIEKRLRQLSCPAGVAGSCRPRGARV
jgi:hypothetical protein